jgi:Tol biopolymer transport system component
VFASVVLVFVVSSFPAGATPPGVNGQIAWDNPNGAGTVYAADANGHQVHRLTSPSSCCAAWSADGKRLLVSGNANDGRIATSIVNADGTGFHTLPLTTPGLSLACTVWSPNGKDCAAQGWDDKKPSVNGVYLVNVANGRAVRLTSNPLRGYDIPGDYSPDGSRIVFGRYNAAQVGSRCTSSTPTAADCTGS